MKEKLEVVELLREVIITQVILMDLIPSRQPNLPEAPLSGAAKTNLMFSRRENALTNCDGLPWMSSPVVRRMVRTMTVRRVMTM